jgi:hypothetical protein
MDPTASSFSTAEQMITKGTAPAVDYDIKPSNGGLKSSGRPD